MKFVLLDRIVSIEVPSRIVARKSLSLAEEYLADHFPTFPVMPGVLQLESMIQAAAWLVRVKQSFSRSMVVLEEAKNVNYKSFVVPGQSLEVTAEAVRIDDASSDFKTVGRSPGGEEIVKARLKLRHYNLADRDEALADTDARLVSDLRATFGLLGGPSAIETAETLTNNG